MVSKSNQSKKWKLITTIVLITLLLVKYGVDQYYRASDDVNRHAHITYSHHARCRMACRHIDQEEVQEVLLKGHINHEKSNTHDGKVAIEAITKDNQEVRIIFAKEGANKMVVVTCIDLDTDWPCHCN